MFNCPLCGNELCPRKFEVFDGEFVYGIFDNCLPFVDQLVYDTEQEAIEAFFK